MRHHVFISYSHQDRLQAEEVEKALRAQGFRCWRDPQLRCGPQFPKRLQMEIAESQALLVLVSRGAAKSEWVKREIRMAQRLRIPIVPVLLYGKGMPAELDRLLGGAKYESLAGAEPAEIGRRLRRALRAVGVGALTDAIDLTFEERLAAIALPALQTHPAARERLQRLAQITYERFENTPGPGLWTVHGLRHTHGLLQHLGALASPALREGEPEACFCLAVAACLHDAGLVVRDVDPNLEATARAAATGQIIATCRQDHHRRSRDLLYRIAGEAGLVGGEATLAADLCGYHNWRTKVHERVGETPRLGELISLFRIANACDLGPLRAPPYFWEIFAAEIKGVHGESAEAKSGGDPQNKAAEANRAVWAFWLRNLLVRSVEIDAAKHIIALTAQVPAPEFAFVPHLAFERLRSAIAELTPFAGPWRLDVHVETEAEWPAPLELATLIRFGAELCADPGAVVWSSSDIWDYFTQAVWAAARRKGGSGERADAGEKDILEVLWQLAEELPRRRPELHSLQHLAAQCRRIREEEEGSRLQALAEEMARMRREHQLSVTAPESTAFSRIAATAFRRLDKRLGGKAVWRLFLFGYSGPVAAFIEYSLAHGKEIEIVTPLMRPVGEGPTLKIWERFATQKGVRVEIIPDAAIPLALAGRNLGPKRAAPKAAEVGCATAGNGQAAKEIQPCAVVLMGCEALLQEPEKEAQPSANGGKLRAGREGWAAANSLGSLAVAQLAKMNGVPVWILTECSKAVGDRAISYWLTGQGNIDVPLAAFIHEIEASRITAAQETTWPRSELIPGELIEAVITEKGVNQV